MLYKSWKTDKIICWRSRKVYNIAKYSPLYLFYEKKEKWELNSLQMRKEIHLKKWIMFRLVLSFKFYTDKIILLYVQIERNEWF